MPGEAGAIRVFFVYDRTLGSILMRILFLTYDNGSHIGWFPQGIAYIVAYLQKNGIKDIDVYSQDIHHYPENHLTDFLDKNKFDIIGVGLIAGYYQYQKLKMISKAINRSKNRPFYVLGGHGPSPDPSYFIKITSADAVVVGEGEETMLELVKACANGIPLYKVKGIAFNDITGRTVITESRPLIKDLDMLPMPAYHMFPMEVYRLMRFPRVPSTDFAMPVLTGRGCTFRCNFCYRLDKGHRSRSNESITEEISYLKSDYRVGHIDFSDELLMISKERTISLCEDIIRSKLNISWSCNGRLNYATDEVVALMRRAGCNYINYGIEAMDDDVLKRMKKGLRVRQVYKGINTTLKHGISPGFNIIFGHILDTKETLQKAVDFLLEYNDHSELRTIRPVTPYPGSPLFNEAVEMGLIKDTEDFYENKHLNSDLLAANFTDMTDDEFYDALLDANARLISKYYDFIKQEAIDSARNLYLSKDVSFRGFRQH